MTDHDHNHRHDAIPEQDFMQWLLSNGTHINHIGWPLPTSSTGSRGAIALHDLPASSTFMEMPEALLITPKVCARSTSLGAAFARHADVFRTDEELMLTLYIMGERRRAGKSFWAPYLRILPKEIVMVNDWTEEEKEELQDVMVVGEGMRLKRQLDYRYRKAAKLLNEEEKKSIGFNEKAGFVWAHRIVMTRTFARRLPWCALVPFADCLNHANLPVKYELTRTGSKGVFRMFTAEDSGAKGYRKGDEVFFSYGRRSNRYLLLTYGFVLRRNEWNEYAMQVGLQRDMQDFKAVAQLLRRVRLGTYKVFCLTERGLCKDFLTFCRAVVLSREDRRKAMDEQVDVAQPVSLSSEIRALRHAENLIISSLNRLPTTLEDDATTLEQLDERRNAEPADTQLRTAVLYRMGNKAVAHAHLAMLSVALKGLKRAEASVPEVDIESSLKTHMQQIYEECSSLSLSSSSSSGSYGRKKNEVRDRIELV